LVFNEINGNHLEAGGRGDRNKMHVQLRSKGEMACGVGCNNALRVAEGVECVAAAQ
jgi:hypothetical protein